MRSNEKNKNYKNRKLGCSKRRYNFRRITEYIELRKYASFTFNGKNSFFFFRSFAVNISNLKRMMTTIFGHCLRVLCALYQIYVCIIRSTLFLRYVLFPFEMGNLPEPSIFSIRKYYYCLSASKLVSIYFYKFMHTHCSEYVVQFIRRSYVACTALLLCNWQGTSETNWLW